MCIWHAYRKHRRPVISTVVLKLNDFSRSQAVTYTVKSLIYRKLCKIETLARVVLQKPFSAHSTELRREIHWLPIKQRIEYKIAAITITLQLQGEALWSTGLFTRYTIFFTATRQQGLCVHQPPTICSVLHSSVRSLTGRSRLQHLPLGTLCRHQLDPLALLVLLNLDLKPICSRQHTSRPRTVQRYLRAP